MAFNDSSELKIISNLKIQIWRDPIIEEDIFLRLSPKTLEVMCRNHLVIYIDGTSREKSMGLRYMRNWCRENCECLVYIVNDREFYFENPEEATGFKLKWLQAS